MKITCKLPLKFYRLLQLNEAILWAGQPQQYPSTIIALGQAWLIMILMSPIVYFAAKHDLLIVVLLSIIIYSIQFHKMAKAIIQANTFYVITNQRALIVLRQEDYCRVQTIYSQDLSNILLEPSNKRWSHLKFLVNDSNKNKRFEPKLSGFYYLIDALEAKKALNQLCSL
jgi:hypothetical protein